MSSRSSQHLTTRSCPWRDGTSDALNEMMPAVYDELRRQAHRYIRHEHSDNSLQTTDLIDEVYIKLAGQKNADWRNRAHFFAVAAQLMRRILIDHARGKHRTKRGGHAVKLPLNEATLAAGNEQSLDLLALDEALTGLAEFDAQLARVVELKYFGGLTIEETAEALQISHATVERDWQMAKAYLFRQLR